jgi:hypothetical protein
MLRDPTYEEINRQFGGIFLSCNGIPALFPALVSGAIPLPEPLARTSSERTEASY